ncbi:MAG: peroxidase-related enzyme [Sphingomonas sp.]|nr:peroxidase-related enzyme [Sphingomonas sp.]
MARISIPATAADAPVEAQPLLASVQAALGTVPNLHRLVANSPATLDGYLSLGGALGKGKLAPKTREAIALAVANVNHCTYCNSAHGYIAKNLLKVSDDEIAANRQGGSTDAFTNAAIVFATSITEKRGAVDATEVEAVRAAGYTDAQILEIVGHVALNTLTNYVNEVFKTDVDFPVAEIAG